MEEPVYTLKVLPRLTEAAFSREDEGDDRDFYRSGRPDPPLDTLALQTVQELIGQLVVETTPEVLDLAAGAASHLPDTLQPARVVGLGLDEPALRSNPALDEVVIHDLNADPRLPFVDRSFDVVLCTFSMAYLVRPFEVFDEVGRVLRPGGLCLVVFTNRHVSRKAVAVFRDGTEGRRVTLVEEMLQVLGAYERIGRFRAVGRPRPEGDRFADCGLPSDPIYAVWGERRGESRDRPHPESIEGVPFDPEVVERKRRLVGQTLCCPYCDQALVPWPVPQTPFTEWACEDMYVCMNNRCPYLCRGWAAMDDQGNRGYSYRLMYNPDLGRCVPVPVAGLRALREDRVLPRG